MKVSNQGPQLTNLERFCNLLYLFGIFRFLVLSRFPFPFPFFFFFLFWELVISQSCMTPESRFAEASRNPERHASSSEDVVFTCCSKKKKGKRRRLHWLGATSKTRVGWVPLSIMVGDSQPSMFPTCLASYRGPFGRWLKAFGNKQYMFIVG